MEKGALKNIGSEIMDIKMYFNENQIRHITLFWN